MTCTGLLELQVKPECVDAAIAAFGELLPSTRTFEGCVEVYAHQDQDDSLSIVLISVWDNREDYEKYVAWRTETGVISQLTEFLTAEPSFRYFDKKA